MQGRVWQDSTVDLAQTNLARARHRLDDPRMVEFVKAIDRANAVGDRSRAAPDVDTSAADAA